MAMRLVPCYVEYFGVVKAMNQIANEPGAANKSINELRSDLNFKASFQYVDDSTLGGSGGGADGGNGQVVRLDRSNGKANLVVSYDKKVPFVYNIDFLVHFNKTVPLKGDVG
jgi:hypothetical protein